MRKFCGRQPPHRTFTTPYAHPSWQTSTTTATLTCSPSSLHPTTKPPTVTGKLHAYDHTGTLRWHHHLGKHLTVRDRPFEPFFFPSHLRYLTTPADTYILTTARHRLWYPTQVHLLQPDTGSIISEYWHPGHIETITTHDLNQDGTPELILGGMNNPDHGPGHPTISILPIPFTTSTNHPNLFGPNNSKEHTYLLFPRPDLTDIHTALVGVHHITSHNNHLTITIGDSTSLLFIYTLNANLDITDLRAHDDFVRRHDELATQGFLDHTYTPGRARPLPLLQDVPHRTRRQQPGSQRSTTRRKVDRRRQRQRAGE